jgi:hypothetical protein
VALASPNWAWGMSIRNGSMVSVMPLSILGVAGHHRNTGTRVGLRTCLKPTGSRSGGNALAISRILVARSDPRVPVIRQLCDCHVSRMPLSSSARDLASSIAL